METIYLNRENLSTWQKRSKPNVVALGFFDGLHQGHNKVINTALEKAKEKNVSLSVMSFFPHPKTVLSNGKKQVHYLMPLSEKKERLKNLGVDTFYIVSFDKEFASLSPEQFATDYLINLGVVHAVAGFDFTYGSMGTGNMERLKDDTRGIIGVTKVGKVGFNGEKISSTRIRETIIKGNIEELPYLLGRAYEVKCEWNGLTLKLHPYYTIPSQGRYAISLKNEKVSIRSEVIVTRNQKGLSLKFLKEIHPSMKGKLSIVWHHRILEENDSCFDENNRFLVSV